MPSTRRSLAVGVVAATLLAVAPAAARPAPTSDAPATWSLHDLVDRHEAAVADHLSPGRSTTSVDDKDVVHGLAPRPDGVDPSRSLVADTQAWETWRRSEASRLRATLPATAGARSAVDENEVSPGSNDSPEDADPVTLTDGEVVVRASFSLPPYAGDPVGPFAEDDGSITSATPLDLEAGTVRVRGTVGDGPHGTGGTGNGDFDHMAVELAAGESFHAHLTPAGGALDGVLVVYDPAGNEVTSNDDARYDSLDPAVQVTAESSGTYTLAVSAYPAQQGDPFDSSSGDRPYDEPTSYPEGLEGAPTGDYLLEVAPGPRDVDAFTLPLGLGDVLEVAAYGPDPLATGFGTVAGADQVAVLPAALLGYPDGSPFDADAGISLPRVVERDGDHVVLVTGLPGDYELRIAVHPGGGANGGVQKVFVDLDGHTLNPARTFGAGPDEARALSPFADFAAALGVEGSEQQVADAIVNRITDVFVTLDPSGLDVALPEVVTSRDVPDPGDDPDTLRLVVGGTIDELGVTTIGLAPSIDVGNFRRGETGVVLLDLLSASAGESGGISLNDYAVAAETARPSYVGHALGSIAAHEAGHMLGDFHTDLLLTTTPSLMDPGGDVTTMYGLGPDAKYGTADDVEAHFVEDMFDLLGTFFGIHDTVVTTARALATTDVATPSSSPVLLLGGESALSRGVEREVLGLFGGNGRRVAGGSRYDTAARIVADAWPDTVDEVYLATGEKFPDALAGAALAGRDGAPVLLTAQAALPDATVTELRRLSPATVTLLGGEGAVSRTVEDQVRAALPTADVVRLAGGSRYDTAARIVADGWADPVEVVYVATGAAFPDALAGAAAAAVVGAPVLLVAPDAVPAETEAQLRRLAPATVKLLGGETAVNAVVADRLAELSGGRVERLAGGSRYDTAAAIVDDAFPGGVPVTYVATGERFPDALAGAAAAGSRRGPVVLVAPDDVPAAARKVLDRLS